MCLLGDKGLRNVEKSDHHVQHHYYNNLTNIIHRWCEGFYHQRRRNINDSKKWKT